MEWEETKTRYFAPWAVLIPSHLTIAITVHAKLHLCPVRNFVTIKTFSSSDFLRERVKNVQIKNYVDIMAFDFLHFVFFQVQYIHYCWKHYVEISAYFYMEVINWKENKEVGTICCEIRISMKKPKIFMEFFKRFRNNNLYLDTWISFWKKTKIFVETFLYREKVTEK